MRVLTVGGAMIDTIALIDDERIERMAMSNAQSSFLLLEEGKKVEAADVTQHCGGGAINTAVCFSRLGHQTSSCVKLGNDDRANVILRRLQSESVATDWISHDETFLTGTAIIVASHERDAAIFTYRGANTMLRREDFKSGCFETDLTYIASLSNEAADCFSYIISNAKSAGSKVAANPGIRQLTSRTADFYEALPNIDLLSINRTEASALVPSLVSSVLQQMKLKEAIPDGLDLLRRGLSFAGHDMSMISFLVGLREKGANSVLITDGKGGTYFFRANELIYCPAMEATVAGTAGAGDAFASTFTSTFFEGNDPKKALQAAAVNAASVVGFIDTQTGLLKADALEEKRRANAPALPIQSWRVK